MDGKLYQFQSIANLDDLDVLEHNGFNPEGNQVEKNAFKTAPNYFDSETTHVLKSRSKKPLLPSKMDLSFENSILDSHFEALKYMLKEFFYIDPPSTQVVTLQALQMSHVSSDFQQNRETLHKVAEGLSKFPKDNVAQFIKDLENQDNLTKFLILIPALVSEQLAQELIFLAFLVWEKYLEQSKDILFPNTEEISQKVKEKIKKDLQGTMEDTKVDLQSLRAKKTVELPILDFVQRFTETVYLVIQEFFDNPYAPGGENPFKRSSSALFNDFSHQEENEESWEYNFKQANKRKKF